MNHTTLIGHIKGPPLIERLQDDTPLLKFTLTTSEDRGSRKPPCITDHLCVIKGRNCDEFDLMENDRVEVEGAKREYGGQCHILVNKLHLVLI